MASRSRDSIRSGFIAEQHAHIQARLEAKYKLEGAAEDMAKALQAVLQQEKSGHPSVCKVAVGGQCSCWLSLARAALKKAGLI